MGGKTVADIIMNTYWLMVFVLESEMCILNLGHIQDRPLTFFVIIWG